MIYMREKNRPVASQCMDLPWTQLFEATILNPLMMATVIYWAALVVLIFSVGQLQEIQTRFPLSLGVDALMANCAWEFMVFWNRDPEAVFALEQAIVYLRCIQNAVLQHGERNIPLFI